MFTQDRFRTDPKGKSDRIGPLLTRDRFRTGPERIQTVPCKQKPIQSDPVRFGPVTRKRSLRVRCALQHSIDRRRFVLLGVNL